MNWEQFKAILWLRWRLSRNQMMRGSGAGVVIAAIAAAALVVLGVAATVAGLLVGALALEDVRPHVAMFVWDGVVAAVIFFWLIAVLTEVQRSESIDLTRLLHLPIGLRQVFVFNYLLSLVSAGTVLGGSAMLGLATGLVIGNGWKFLLALPLVVGFLFMVTAWIYCLRGWLLSLMVNPRRRRAIIMWITLGIVLAAQTPQFINLAVQRKARAEREARRAAQKEGAPPEDRETRNRRRGSYFSQLGGAVAAVHPWVPVLWLPNGVRGLASGDVLPALWGGAGMLALGWIGISRAYRATVRFYRADEPVKPLKAGKAERAPPAKPAVNWVEKRLSWLPEETAAMALAQLRSMTRAPEVRMMLAMAMLMSILLPAMFVWRGGVGTSPAGKPFLGTGIVVMVLFMLVQLVCNQFGADRDGFRGLVLLPSRRERLLLGKNLALFPLAAATAFVPIMAISFFGKLPLLMVLTTVLQFVAAFTMFCTVGNLASILVPYRIAAGSLKPTKQSWQTTLFMMLVHILFPVAAAPVFIPPLLGLAAQHFAGLSAALVSLAAALVMAVVFGIVYVQTLRPLGRLLQRRETKILTAVTEVRE